MKKRLRKKKHRGEFNTKGFHAEGTFTRSLTSEEADSFIDAFIAFAESNDLGLGGGTSLESFGQYITRHVPGTRRNHGARGGRPRWRDANCTEADRALVEKWLRARPYVSETSLSIGELQPSWW